MRPRLRRASGSAARRGRRAARARCSCPGSTAHRLARRRARADDRPTTCRAWRGGRSGIVVTHGHDRAHAGSCPLLVVTTTVARSLAILVLRVLAFAPGRRVMFVRLARHPATAAIFAGAGVALADERTDAPESAFTPPRDERPVPPAT